MNDNTIHGPMVFGDPVVIAGITNALAAQGCLDCDATTRIGRDGSGVTHLVIEHHDGCSAFRAMGGNRAQRRRRRR